jgi:hypothetical protein
MYLFVTEEPKNLCGQRFEMSCPPVRKKSHDRDPIWDLFEEVADNLTDEILVDLPTDGFTQHDHYLYGSPKQ